jgi:hypothetical protein
MIGIQTWFELSINYFEDFWVEWKKGVSYFFQGRAHVGGRKGVPNLTRLV